MDRTFHVYMMASKSGVLYVGMTNNLERRVIQHKQKRNPDSLRNIMSRDWSVSKNMRGR